VKNWISVNTKLPKLREPVLCIIKANCGCEHYIPAVLARVNILDDDWRWLANDPKNADFVQCPKENVKAWQPIEKFPIKYIKGFDR
jgi:hypothetical protein